MQSKYDLIKDIVLRNIPDEGNFPTSIKGVNFIRRDTPSEFSKCFYTSACIFVLQGQKQMIFSSEVKTYKKGQYVLSCTDIPAVCRVEKASKEEPFVGILLEFDENLMKELIITTKFAQNTKYQDEYLAITDADSNLTDAFYRLVQLVENPQDDVIVSMMIKEIYYRLLTGPFGNQLLLINTKGTCSNQIAKAISYLKSNYKEKLNIDEIAQSVNMAPSSFYRHFRKITQVSPLQYQKQLRLQEAQRLMLTGDYNAETASYNVGYESPTQFSREYKKMFGNPPKTDIKILIS
ncbi:MAG: AraC family transcriptional regulator [Candidatus Gastranaerophilaceae bacterium]